METGLTQWAQELSASAVMDYLRWGRVSVGGEASTSSTATLMEAAGQAYMDQVEQVRSFLSARKEFLYSEWAG